jgi:two-component system sensor kinase FixL
MTPQQLVDDVVDAPAWAAPGGWSTSPVARAAALSAGYLALCLILDRLTFIGALHGVGITPWNPSTGLAMALLIVKGTGYIPLILGAELLSSATLPIVTVPAAPLLLGSLIVAIGYGGAAAMLRHGGFRSDLRRSSDAVKLLIVTVIGSGVVAWSYVAVYAVAGIVPWRGLFEAGYHFWIGEAIGIVVFVPPVLLLRERIIRNSAEHGSASRQLLEFAAQGAAIVMALAVVFSGDGVDHSLGLFYLLFLPLIWIAMRHGQPLTNWAVLAIQLGLIAGLEVQGYSEPTLRAFQLLMFALAATGLMLGAVVSERHRLSRALVESECRRTAILNTARDGVMTLDARGRIESVNPAVERLFSRRDQHLIGRDVAELVEDAPDLLQRLKIAAGSPPSESDCREFDARRADGGTFPIELSAGRFDLEAAEHYTVVIRDITARRKAEAQYREHQAELAHVSRISLAGEMAAGLAHELSQPLTAITAFGRGCLRLLVQPASEPEMLHEGIAEVVHQAERAGDILDRLREFVRGGENRRILTEPKTLIDAAVSFTRAESVRQRIEVEAAADPGLPTVLADRIQIEQVLLNLLRNAMEAMDGADSERRSIVVTARRKNPHAVEFSVADSGPGVNREVKDSIFEPFVTTKPLGMGMGLSISRSIIESHGGSLRMVRRLPSGTIFFFDLPSADAQREH